MNNTTTKPHWSFWFVGVIALLWNVLGSMNYLMQMNAEVVAALPDTHKAIIVGRPTWATGGFAIAVFGGAVASLLLLLKKALTLQVFIASLLGTLVTMIHTVRVANSTSFSGGEMFVMILLPIIVGALFIWYAYWSRGKGWVG